MPMFSSTLPSGGAVPSWRARPWRKPGELTAMCSLAVPARDDLIAGRDHVIDGHSHARERRSVHGRDALESVGAAQVTHVSGEGGVVVGVFGGNELVDQLEVADIEALLEEPA
jgi:hypothetical protein